MRVHRGAFAALVGGAALLVGSGTAALAGSSNPGNGQDHQAACQARRPPQQKPTTATLPAWRAKDAAAPTSSSDLAASMRME